MKNIPIVFRFIINIFLYIIYTFVGHLLFGVMFAFILKTLGKRIPLSTDPIFVKIAIVASLFVLVVSLIFRKYFYITLINNEEEYIEKDIKNKKESDETMKIYIEKELDN